MSEYIWLSTTLLFRTYMFISEVSHEDWITSNKYFQELRKTQINGWARAKEELYQKAVATFADAFLAEELQRVEAINAKKQKEICSALYEKVQLWRERKLEIARLEAELQRKNREKLDRERLIEAEKEKKRRDSEKQKQYLFNSTGKIFASLIRLTCSMRRDNNKRNLKRQKRGRNWNYCNRSWKEQAKIDKERVAYRREVEDGKRLKLEEKKHQLYLDEIEREKRLDAIRQLVAVNVESDPYRVMKPTMASNAKLGIGAEEDINIQKPLFDMRGFSSEQVANDPRVKLEQALRQAGLHENPYARKMIFDTKPHRPPRKDMESTVFKKLDK
ncbi:putative coiled-coil domain-containing protein [Apostichopus japonicus]|uniref:Putative coiled-coil domain-containing protein n=1 Tax=Stichopus japonicus TaxID=307972 RepID=A0A2G8L0T5_STIJA|nr:putative coiled-coil domain-containing protein [Apostichopus japonicus]